MNSLLEKEGMAGKIQTIYIDPPYGIKFGSNWQVSTRKRDVKDGKDDDMTREVEQIKAFRDTWELGVHSYLTYLRDRFLLARELLTSSGSCFVQISDENLHFIRNLMDEVFGSENFVSVITFRKKKMPLGSKYLEILGDYIVFYAKDKTQLKYRGLFELKDTEGDNHWNYVELMDGERRKMTSEEVNNHQLLPTGSDVYSLNTLYPAGFNQNAIFPVKFK